MNCLAHCFGNEGEHAEMARTFNGNDKLPLVPGTGAGDPLGDNLALFVDTTLEALFILIIDVHVLAVAEPARPFLALLLVFPRRAGRTVGVNRKRWFSYHGLISVSSNVVCEIVRVRVSAHHHAFAAGSGAAEAAAAFSAAAVAAAA
jgi:hypothetical protein